MADFNVIVPHYSVMLADSFSSIIQSQYKFKNEISMELLSAKMNDIYRVKSGDFSYYLRIPRHERFWPYTKTNYDFEMELCNYLRKSDLPVSYPIPTNAKKFLGILNAPEGVRYFSLHTAAEGTKPDVMNIDDMKLMGKYLARFHNITQNYSSNYKPLKWDFSLLIDYGMNKLQKHIPSHLKSDFKYIYQKTTELIKQFNEYIPSKTEHNWGVIHGNYVPEKIRKQNSELTLFDFEYCGLGYRIFDIVFMIHKTNILNLKTKQFHAFLEGYQQIRPLSEGEQNALQILAKLALISRMTRTSGMRDLVGVLWFEEQVENDLKIVRKLL